MKVGPKRPASPNRRFRFGLIEVDAHIDAHTVSTLHYVSIYSGSHHGHLQMQSQINVRAGQLD